MKRPWLKFYPADWRSDPRLRMCSLAARGLWIDLISYMHEGEPYGHLTVNGRAPKMDQVASLVGRPPREVEAAFGELISLGVCSTDGGSIVSRRMVKDNDRSEEGREQVMKRYPNRPPTRSDDKTPTRPPTAEPKSPPSSEPTTQKLEAREEKKEATCSEVEPVRPKLKYPAAFEGWWLAYPRTPVMSKKEAIAAWQRLSEPDRLAAVAALPKYAAFLKSKPDHPTVHACRFLSQRRFDGFEEAPQPAATAPVGFYAADDSPELDAWDGHYRSTKGINAPRDHAFGWRFPTQWPPGHEVKNGTGTQHGTQGTAPGIGGAFRGTSGAQAEAAGVSGREPGTDLDASDGGGNAGRAAAPAGPARGFTIE